MRKIILLHFFIIIILLALVSCDLFFSKVYISYPEDDEIVTSTSISVEGTAITDSDVESAYITIVLIVNSFEVATQQIEEGDFSFSSFFL